MTTWFIPNYSYSLYTTKWDFGKKIKPLSTFPKWRICLLPIPNSYHCHVVTLLMSERRRKNIVNPSIHPSLFLLSSPSLLFSTWLPSQSFLCHVMNLIWSKLLAWVGQKTSKKSIHHYYHHHHQQLIVALLDFLDMAFLFLVLLLLRRLLITSPTKLLSFHNTFFGSSWN